MNQILNKLEKNPNFKDLLRKTCKSNQLPITILNGFSSDKIKSIYTRLLKHYEQHNLKGKTLWFQNQLKIFFWILIIWSLIHSKLINDFNDDDWNQIKHIFIIKDIYTFKYEAKKILSTGRKNSRVWNQEQNKLLQKIMSDESIKNKWNQVARMFYELSNHKYFRTGKQCRQHWLNHLDPSKKHGKWSRQQDQIILKYVFQNGKKWSSISKDFLLHRTEHMIKNRFKSLIFKQKRKYSINQADELKILKKIIRKNDFLTSKILTFKTDSQSQKPLNYLNQQQQSKKQYQNIETITKQNHSFNHLQLKYPLNNTNFQFYTQFFKFHPLSMQLYQFEPSQNIFYPSNNNLDYLCTYNEGLQFKHQNEDNLNNLKLSENSNFVLVKPLNEEVNYQIANKL